MIRNALCAALLSAVVSSACAHPVSLTSAQAVVTTNAVETRIEVMLEDFMMFYGLMPGEGSVLAREDIEVGMERHKAFLLRDFIIRDVDGARLEGAVVSVSGDPIPEGGVEVTPSLKRLDFYGLRFSDFALRPEPKRLSALTARVGAILSYSTEGSPSDVDILWEYFNAAVFTARTAVYACDKTIRHHFSPYRPKLSWRNPGIPDLPKITVVHVGRGTGAVKVSDAETIVASLVRNVYRAFDYRAENDIYDALERSVHGELLAELYLKIRKGLTMQAQGGAVSRVESVEVTGCSLVGKRKTSDRFVAELTWTVEGTVEHWGHVHTRVNQYRAEFGIRAVENAWKIETMRVLDQKQLKYQVKLRGI